MKKGLLALACGMLMTASAFAELPDFTKVWQDIKTGKLDEAQVDTDALYSDYRAANEGKKWAQSHSKESSKDVEEWLHFYLVKFYTAHLQGNQEEMNRLNTSIQQLAYLEYMGKPMVE